MASIMKATYRNRAVVHHGVAANNRANGFVGQSASAAVEINPFNSVVSNNETALRRPALMPPSGRRVPRSPITALASTPAAAVRLRAPVRGPTALRVIPPTEPLPCNRQIRGDKEPRYLRLPFLPPVWLRVWGWNPKSRAR
jgi:hypothetical protein